MYGPDIHSMFTGFFRGGNTVIHILQVAPYAFLDQHDIRALINFGGHVMTNINVENAFTKYGQSQIEFNTMKQLWLAGKYEQAGESAAEALMNLTEYEIPQIVN